MTVLTILKPDFISFFFFHKTGSQYIAQVGLEHIVFYPSYPVLGLQAFITIPGFLLQTKPKHDLLNNTDKSIGRSGNSQQ